VADQGGAIQRLGVTSAVIAFVVGLTACNAGSPSASPSLGASSSPSAGASTSQSAAASESARPSGPPTSSTNLFSLLPAAQPADYLPEIACTGEIGPSDPVAIVRMAAAQPGTGAVLLRDYADPANPTTPCTIGRESIAQLIDARHVVIPGNGALAVVDLPELRYHWFQLPDPREFLAVGPQLDRVLWKLTDWDGGEDTVYVSTSAGDRLIASLPTPGSGRCGSPEFDSRTAAYTLSGSHLFVLNEPVPQFTSLVALAGETTLLSVIPPTAGWPDTTGPLMALWSPTTETLYYRQGGDVWQWTGGSDPQLFLSGVNWVQPTISSDGAHLAYSVLRSDGVLHDTFLIDLADGGSPSPQKIGDGARKLPVFLNATQLWFKSEGEDHGCAGAEAEKPLIYDIVDRLEFNSVIEQPMLVWPATSSNF
jgi:hypothetical protein